MCGIAGIVHWGTRPDAPARVTDMARCMRHRGPDDERTWSDADAAFGFARLSIVDLAGGTQPMANEDGTLIVVFNGEIYNHRELRVELERAGHVFSSDHSDTEVIVHGAEQWGADLPRRLKGMFAFAAWSSTRRELLMARDRHGIKPMYLAKLPTGGLAFASEVRALAASGCIEMRATPAGVLEYLSLQNFWDGRTPFEGVELFPPGHVECVTHGNARRSNYWDFSFDRPESGDLGQAAEAHREILLSVMQRQMAADVPVMAYLSGGIDSTAVSVAAHRLDRQVKTYSCIFDLTGVGDDRFVDEREFSRAVAREHGLERVEYEVSRDALTTALDATIDALEYPRMGMAYVNYLIAGRVSRDAKVVLSGMGGDEMHGGYVARYAAVARRSPTVSLLERVRRCMIQRMRPGGGAANHDVFATYRSMLAFPVLEARRSEAFTPEFLAAAGDFPVSQLISEKIGRVPTTDPWDVVMYVDAKTYLHGLLVLEDKLSMAHSLETRVPLLDEDLVDFLLRLPWDLLCDGETGKKVFRHSVRPWVPESVFNKPKMGFGPPDASWYRGVLRPWIQDRLCARRIAARGIMRPEFVQPALDAHFAGTANNLPLIWSLLSLDSWCEQWGVFGGRLDAAH